MNSIYNDFLHFFSSPFLFIHTWGCVHYIGDKKIPLTYFFNEFYFFFGIFTKITIIIYVLFDTFLNKFSLHNESEVFLKITFMFMYTLSVNTTANEISLIFSSFLIFQLGDIKSPWISICIWPTSWIETKDFSTNFYLKMLKNLCLSYILPRWDWHVKNLAIHLLDLR